jgi:hypothetical protein
MFDFDITPEQKAAELARWDGIERRRYSSFTDLYPKQFSERRGLTAEPDDLASVYNHHFPRQQQYRTDTALRIREVIEDRSAFTGYPVMPCEDRARLLRGFVCALPIAALIWGALYLVTR